MERCPERFRAEPPPTYRPGDGHALVERPIRSDGALANGRGRYGDICTQDQRAGTSLVGMRFGIGPMHPASRLFLAGLLALSIFATVRSQQTSAPRPHPRIERTEVDGRRVALTTLKGARLFVGPNFKAKGKVPLLVHFHGAPWLIEYHAARHLPPSAALITVQLGAGSRAYGLPFEQSESFRDLIDEAARVVGQERGWSSVTLSGFSAGYGAVRAILRDESNFRLVDNVLLLDGIHAGYTSERAVRPADLDSFLRFAGEAVRKNKAFVITHSQIFPGTYASTTECSGSLLEALGIVRRRVRPVSPSDMQLLSTARKGGFYVFGYAGETASDHIDHLHAMDRWFRFLEVR